MNIEQPSTRIQKNPFWEFALDFYDNSEVSDLLLTFQNKLNMDVNLIIFCVWISTFEIKKNDIKNILESSIQISTEFQSDIISNIRKSRFNLKFLLQNLKAKYLLNDNLTYLVNDIKQIELEMEALEVFSLYNNFVDNYKNDLSLTKTDKLKISHACKYLNVYFKLTETNYPSDMKKNIKLKIQGYFSNQD